jgi:hypothetical protein
MTARIARPLAFGAAWSRRLGVFAFVLMATVALAHRYGFVATPDLVVLACVVLGFAAASLGLGLIAYRRYWYFGDRGGGDVLSGFFWTATTLVPFAVVAYWSLAYPALTDISTDLEDPPSMSAAEAERTPDMNPVRAPTPESVIEQAESYPLAAGRRYDLPLDRVYAGTMRLIEAEGWRIQGEPQAGEGTSTATVQALATSPVLSLPADVSIRLTDDGTTTSVDMRSASRYGDRDFGENAARIVRFLAALDAEMAAQLGLPAAADG